ncbi:MAG: serine hydrolase, partial [Planctomycetota bacterium]
MGLVACGPTSEGDCASPMAPVQLSSVSVSPATATLKVGQTLMLQASARAQCGSAVVSPSIAWSSQNPSIASVSNSGLVTAVAPGSTEVHGSAGGKTGITQIRVDSVPADSVTVASVNVSPAETTASVGSAVSLTATVMGSDGSELTDRVVTWVSGDPSIASVSTAGRVTGLAAGGPVVITATAGGVSGTAEVTFVTAVIAPTRLAFTVQPGSVQAGSVLTPAVVVSATDAAGNIATSFSGTITMAIGANPGGSTLGGTKARAAQSGVATFGNLTLDQAGSGYTLNATGTNLTAATSSPFDITAPPSGPYYPPPASTGGWRSHVVLGQTPSAQAKQDILRDTGVDWDTLAQAWGIVSSYGGSFLVVRNGWVIGEWGDAGSGGAQVASVTKSLTSMAMGKIFDLSATGGLPAGITLSSPAVQFLPASWNDVPAKQNIQLRHMMTMSSGLRQNDNPYAANWLSVILSEPVVAPPGTVYAYTSAAVDLLSLVVEDVTGQTLGAFFANRIGNPIGVQSLSFTQFSGHTRAAAGAYVNARDLARLAYLLLRNGVWDSGSGPRQILRSSTVSTLTRWESSLGGTTFQNDQFQNDPQSRQRYGHLFWTNRNGSNLL